MKTSSSECDLFPQVLDKEVSFRSHFKDIKTIILEIWIHDGSLFH